MKSRHEITLLPTLWPEWEKRAREDWLSCLQRVHRVGISHIGIKPPPPALGGRVLTTGPQGKSPISTFSIVDYLTYFVKIRSDHEYFFYHPKVCCLLCGQVSKQLGTER